MVTLDLDLIVSILHDEDTVPIEEFMALPHSPVRQFDEEDMRAVCHIIERLKRNMRRDGHKFQRNLIRNECSNLLNELWEMGSPVAGLKNKNPHNEYLSELFFHFMILLMNNCRKEHDIGFYAQELCVTSVYLSRAIKKISGKPASRWIDNAIMALAKTLLRKPGITIQEVAAELNFSDQSSFGKFFKKHTAMSPMEYKAGTMSSP